MTSNNASDQPRGTIRADKLEEGMWVYSHPRSYRATPGRVLYRSEPTWTGRPLVSLVLGHGDFNSADSVPAEALFVVATAAEVDDEKDRSRRRLVARQMTDLARLIETTDIPIGAYPSMSMPRNLDRGELERIATIVRATVENPYGSRLEVQFGSIDGFRADWSGTIPPEPEGDAAVIVAEVTAETPKEMKERTSPIGVPKPAAPKRAAVKRSAPVDKRAAADQDDANTRPAGADQ